MKRFTKDSLYTALQIAGLIGLFSYSFIQGNPKAKENLKTSIITNSIATSELNSSMKRLWEEHVARTRNVMLCIVDKLPGTDEAINRLHQNKIEIGNAIKPYYGTAAGEQLTALLETHITILLEVFHAAQAGNTEAISEANKRWFSNADLITEFLCTTNPYLQETDMKIIMKDLLLLTNDQTNQRIKKDYTADIVAYDKAQTEITKLADIFSKGIVQQFPEKFKSAEAE